jgi:DNA-directed RNA polymerase II subunit RPB1
MLEFMSVEDIDHVVRTIRKKYCDSLIDYGTAVGILAAQSISQPLTQYMLDSHHRSVGSGTTKSGIIRISEIYSTCNVNKEQTPAMLIPINPKVFETNNTEPFTLVQEIAKNIEYITFNNFVQSKKIILESFGQLAYPHCIQDQVWIDESIKSHPLMVIPDDLTSWCFRFVIDKSVLILKAVNLELIIHKLKIKHGSMFIISTPEASTEIIIRIWYRTSQKRGVKIEDIYLDELNALLSTPIRGIEKIFQATVEKKKIYTVTADNGFKEEDKYFVSTFGTNLYSVLLYKHLFDTSAITSNSIPDTYDLYGIEAARIKIINETRTIISNSGINIRHLYIYADERTRTGRVTSIERSGLSIREHNNILLRASYQDPIKCLTDAALNSTKSNIYGIAAAQLLGTIPKIGSIYNTVVIDEEFVEKNAKSIDEIIDEI